VSSLFGVVFPISSIRRDIQQVSALERNSSIAYKGVSITNYNPSDEELIEQVLVGQHQDAYACLFQRHIRRVITIAWHFFRTKEAVEDITQETFSKAYFSLSNYRRGASFEQWLAKIAINNCYDELRRRKKRNELLVTDLTDDEATWLEGKLATNSFRNFFSSNDAQNASEIIYKLLSKLSDEDKLVLTLLHAHDYSVKEIAQMLDWSEAKVKIRAFRARHCLRKAFKQLTLAEHHRQSGSRNPVKLVFAKEEKNL
jgi:RNA polymerase sigma factor (sigma-70 family)